MIPLTDVICLVHDQYEITKRFAELIFLHTENFNLIFVDNGSTNKRTKKFLSDGQDQWKLVISEENLGVIRGRNLGVQYITSNYFVNIDNDQFVQKDWLSILHKKMEEGYDIVGKEAWKLVPPNTGGAVIIGNQSVPQDRSYYPYRRCTNKNESFTYIGCGGMLIKRKVYETIGLFDERFGPAYFEDPDFNFRAIQAGFKIGWCPECPIQHIGHSTFNQQALFDKNKQFIRSWSRFKKKWNGYFPKKGELK